MMRGMRSVERVKTVRVADMAGAAVGLAMIRGEDDDTVVIEAEAGLQVGDEISEAIIESKQFGCRRGLKSGKLAGLGRTHGTRRATARPDAHSAAGYTQDRVILVRAFVDLLFRIDRGAAKVLIGPVGEVVVERVETWGLVDQRTQDGIEAHVALVVIHFQQFFQTIHGVKGLNKLLVQHQRARPDGGFGERSTSVASKRIPHHHALGGELPNVGVNWTAGL